MGRGRGKRQPDRINTRHILFVVSGAFDGLEKIVRRRLRSSAVGFAAATDMTLIDDEEILKYAEAQDFIEYGFELEFIGRLPVRVYCHPLNADDLFRILKESEGSIIRQVEQTMAAYGIDVLFRDEALRRIAELAVDEKTGARGLMSVIERVLRDFKFELPSTKIRRLEVTRELVDQPAKVLKDLLKHEKEYEQEMLRRIVEEFAERFSRQEGITIRFTPKAVDRVIQLAAEQGKSVREFCQDRFKDLKFALRLVAQNTGQTEFELNERVVEDPNRELSEWVVRSYRSSSAAASPDQTPSESPKPQSESAAVEETVPRGSSPDPSQNPLEKEDSPDKTESEEV